jgi:hypothetical protein
MDKLSKCRLGEEFSYLRNCPQMVESLLASRTNLSIHGEVRVEYHTKTSHCRDWSNISVANSQEIRSRFNTHMLGVQQHDFSLRVVVFDQVLRTPSLRFSYAG